MDHDIDRYTPTCEIKWFRTEGVMWGDTPLAVTYDNEGVRDVYCLKQKWVSVIAGQDPEWRDVEASP